MNCTFFEIMNVAKKIRNINKKDKLMKIIMKFYMRIISRPTAQDSM